MSASRNDLASIGFTVSVFFAANPDEFLTVYDICVKTDKSSSAVTKAMRHARNQGLVLVETEIHALGRSNLYRPGPELLKMIGRRA